MNELHKRHIVHRDIKPANILLTSTNIEIADVKLADFGFAKKLQNSIAGTQIGTPLYMAPEIFTSDNYTYKADIWSLGVLTYELLYGVPPFKCFRLEDLRKLHREPVNFPEDLNVPEDAKSFIRAMLAYDYNLRPGYERLLGMNFLRDYSLIENSITLRAMHSDNHIEMSQLIAPEFNRRVSADEMTDKEIQGIILSFEAQIKKLDRIFSYKLIYHDDNCLIEFAIEWYLNKIISRIDAEIAECIKMHGKEKKLLMELEGIQGLLKQNFSYFSIIFNQRKQETIRDYGNGYFDYINEALIAECNVFREYPLPENIEKVLFIASIGKALIPNNNFFQELYQNFVAFSLREKGDSI